MKNRGFSLVELSIVLVILGLLVGGILSGQSLIRAAQLRQVSSSLQTYTTAIHSFRDKYFARPGDMANAVSFWGSDSHGCPHNTTPVVQIGTCNGDGDGKFTLPNVAGASDELFRAWQHLANAGLIEGQYTGSSGTSNRYQIVPGTNAPPGKFATSVFAFSQNTGAMFSNVPIGTDVLTFSNIDASNDDGDGAVLLPEEQWNIDTKLDDGLPGTGRVTTYNHTKRAGCSTSDVPATSVYNVTYKTAACHIDYIL